MAKLDKEDLRTISQSVADALKDAFQPLVMEHALQVANDTIHRILDTENYELRQRLQNQIRYLVAEEVEKRIEVTVRWK